MNDSNVRRALIEAILSGSAPRPARRMLPLDTLMQLASAGEGAPAPAPSNTGPMPPPDALALAINGLLDLLGGGQADTRSDAIVLPERHTRQINRYTAQGIPDNIWDEAYTTALNEAAPPLLELREITTFEPPNPWLAGDPDLPFTLNAPTPAVLLALELSGTVTVAGDPTQIVETDGTMAALTTILFPTVGGDTFLTKTGRAAGARFALNSPNNRTEPAMIAAGTPFQGALSKGTALQCPFDVYRPKMSLYGMPLEQAKRYASIERALMFRAMR